MNCFKGSESFDMIRKCLMAEMIPFAARNAKDPSSRSRRPIDLCVGRLHMA